MKMCAGKYAIPMVSMLSAVLRCPASLLHQFVGDVVARGFVPDAEGQAIVRREIALIVNRKIAERASVREILEALQGSNSGPSCCRWR